MNFYLFILGCQYNYYDAKRITHLLSKMGYVYVERESDADIIIILACSVRQKAMDRIWGKIKLWKKLPQKPKIILTACILPQDKKKLIDKVEAIIEPNKFDKAIVKLLNCQMAKPSTINLAMKQFNNILPREAQPQTAYIPIMQGCDNFCTYCAVPYTRGREVSRSINEVVNEINAEIKSGKKHIILLGQNVNSFGKCKNQNVKIKITTKNSKINNDSFVSLLKRIDQLQGEFDYNFMSANPQDFSDELIDFLVKSKKWTRELHLPLQSGNDEILHKMNRKYEAQKYLSIIENCKLKIVNLTLSTDIIVGFPGETKKQFQDTVNLCKKIGFSKAYISQYSPRTGTPAAKMKDNISPAEKKHRWKILNNLINKNSS